MIGDSVFVGSAGSSGIDVGVVAEQPTNKTPVIEANKKTDSQRANFGEGIFLPPSSVFFGYLPLDGGCNCPVPSSNVRSPAVELIDDLGFYFSCSR
jgi:hypothetical protein